VHRVMMSAKHGTPVEAKDFEVVERYHAIHGVPDSSKWRTLLWRGIRKY
jgi:hypothetical protein